MSQRQTEENVQSDENDKAKGHLGSGSGSYTANLFACAARQWKKGTSSNLAELTGYFILCWVLGNF